MNKKGFIIIFHRYYFYTIGIILLLGFGLSLWNSYDININLDILEFDNPIPEPKENYSLTYMNLVKDNLTKLNEKYFKQNCNGTLDKTKYYDCVNLHDEIKTLTLHYKSIKDGSFIPEKQDEPVKEIIEEKPLIEIEKNENYDTSYARTWIDSDYSSNDYELDKKPEINITVLENKVHELTNIERKKHGLKALKYDNKLDDIARGHSEDMAKNDYFEHDNLKGEDPSTRASKAGYNCYKNYGSYYTNGIAENIFQTWTYSSYSSYGNSEDGFNYKWASVDEMAKEIVDGWMNSPGHRENILTKTYDKEGIGVAIVSNEAVYVTQNFC